MRSAGPAGAWRARVRRRASRMIATPIPMMMAAAASAMPTALPAEIPEPLVDVGAAGTVAVCVAVAPGVAMGAPRGFDCVTVALAYAALADAAPAAPVVQVPAAPPAGDRLEAEAGFLAAAITPAGAASPGPMASQRATPAAPRRRSLIAAPPPSRSSSGCSVSPARTAQRSEASGPDIAGVFWSLLYGFSESWTSSWYTLSTFTDQMSCSVPSRMLSTARIAVSIE